MTPPVRPQPMIAVESVETSSRFYQRLLAGASGHGGSEYERIVVDGTLVLQLHQAEVAHHHGPIGEPGGAAGNGVALWFEVAEFEAVVRRVGDLEAEIVTDVHVNPNAHQREIWIRDPDGYLVVFSEARA